MTIRFGAFEFDPDAQQVRRDGEKLRLEPKAFNLLGILLSRRPAVVPRKELHERLWPHTFVTGANLGAVVSQLREALGDEAEGGLIRTVQGFGYAFGAEAIDDTEPPRTTSPGPTVVWQGVTFSLGQGENLLGRVEDGAVFVDEASVSRRHARIVVTGEQATLEDLGSRNGTWLGTMRLTAAAALGDGDSFRLGSALLEFRNPARPRSDRPVPDSASKQA
ncbi:MAG: winged helix-turn-helix domain-containing protein [Acidobacteria bacterium]|nr:winged helix-turn-helix domain-containing protein [Acidobacteriota bacterium]